MLVLLAVLACSSPAPVVDTVDPATGRAGDELKIVGSNFVEGAKVSLGGQALGDLAFKGPVLVAGTVPKGLKPGPHPLVLTNPDGKAASVPDAFTVAAPPVEAVICDKRYTAYVQLAAGRQLIKQDRHWTEPEKRVENLQITFDEIAGIAYEGRKLADGAYCSAILLELNDGSKMVYEDSKELNLRGKAQDLAVVTKRPLSIVAEEPQD